MSPTAYSPLKSVGEKLVSPSLGGALKSTHRTSPNSSAQSLWWSVSSVPMSAAVNSESVSAWLTRMTSSPKYVDSSLVNASSALR